MARNDNPNLNVPAPAMAAGIGSHAKVRQHSQALVCHVLGHPLPFVALSLSCLLAGHVLADEARWQWNLAALAAALLAVLAFWLFHQIVVVPRVGLFARGRRMPFGDVQEIGVIVDFNHGPFERSAHVYVNRRGRKIRISRNMQPELAKRLAQNIRQESRCNWTR